MNQVPINIYKNLDLTVNSVELALTKKCPLNWKFKNISRSYYGLVFILNGKAEYKFNDKTFYGEKNDIVYFKAGDTYITQSIGPVNLEYIVVSFDLTPKNAADLLPFKPINKVSHVRRFEELFHYIEEVYFAKGIGYKIHTKSLVQTLIFELLHDYVVKETINHTPLQGIQAAANYIENNLDLKIDMDTLAEISGYSVSHFRKKFNEYYGMSPIKHLNYIRVERAKDLLKSQMYTMDEIAAMCGFSNIYYFNRVFKKITGCTPKRY